MRCRPLKLAGRSRIERRSRWQVLWQRIKSSCPLPLLRFTLFRDSLLMQSTRLPWSRPKHRRCDQRPGSDYNGRMHAHDRTLPFLRGALSGALVGVVLLLFLAYRVMATPWPRITDEDVLVADCMTYVEACRSAHRNPKPKRVEFPDSLVRLALTANTGSINYADSPEEGLSVRIRVYDAYRNLATVWPLNKLDKFVIDTTGNTALRRLLCKSDHYYLMVFPELPPDKLAQVTRNDPSLEPTSHPRIFKKVYRADTTGAWPVIQGFEISF